MAAIDNLTLWGVWENSAPSNLAPFHLFFYLNTSPSSTPPKTWSSSSGVPPKYGADGVEEYYPPATTYTSHVPVLSWEKKSLRRAAPRVSFPPPGSSVSHAAAAPRASPPPPTRPLPPPPVPPRRRRLTLLRPCTSLGLPRRRRVGHRRRRHQLALLRPKLDRKSTRLNSSHH